jgi:glucose-1-phosphate adenylyltransferase
MMGSDYYKNSGDYPLGIGKNCDIDGAIIDKNVSMGDNVVIRPFPQNANVDHFLYYVRDGVVIIPKNMNVPSGTVIKPES